ncbi:hypothetical protein TIFTF001_030024 [Ficus carica]|uniref:Uncharacterized protein n=1 Tax=Ficus carica TaxID=3494 RepID=A0AA88DSJ3_FICCA|nr:hypothetical protein TIFTF001_030024 [Ficus carica]
MIKSYGRKEEELALILFLDGCATLQFINSCATKSDNGQAALIQKRPLHMNYTETWKGVNLFTFSAYSDQLSFKTITSTVIPRSRPQMCLTSITNHLFATPLADDVHGLET